MERYTVTASYSVSLRQRPTFNTNNPIPFPPKPQHHLRQPSFTSHLRPPVAEEHRLRRLKEDSELSIFDAERYFKEDDDQPDEEARVQRKAPDLGRVDASPDPSDSCSLSSFAGGRRSRHNGSDYATPTASSEASWNSRSGLLSNPPGAVAVSVRTFPLNEQRKGSSSSSSSSACRWLLGRTCSCYGKKAVDIQEKYSASMSPTHSNLDSTASARQSKKDSRAGETCVDEVATALKELEMCSGWEMAKLKVVAGSWTKDQQDLFRDPANHVSPGKHFPPEVACHRVVHSGKPFKDGGGGAAFSLPVLGQPTTASGKTGSSVAPLDDPARDSLEVFRPPEEATALPKSTAELQRRGISQLTLYPRDGAPRRSFTFPTSPSGRVAAVEDDLASDSSSDLFEIESLSTQAASYAGYRRRESLDDPRRLAGGAGGAHLRLRRNMEEAAVAASECYPPSEVSVEWSVATAEGGFGPGSVANFSSAASDCDNAGFTQPDHHVLSTVAAGDGGRRRGGGLLSCRCEKAVSVGPNPVRFGVERRHQLPSDDGGIRAVARVGNGSSTAAQLARVAGAPPALLAPSQPSCRSMLGR